MVEMGKKVYKEAARCVSQAYTCPDFDLGTTEFSLDLVEIDRRKVHIISIPGTNETWDWWKNIDMRSKCGWKKAAYDAANIIASNKHVRVIMASHTPVVIGCHSKGGPTGLRLKSMFPQKKILCVAFEPARGLRNDRKHHMSDTVIFRDPDSVVTKVGWSRFKHPTCRIIDLPNDKWYPSVKDHGMKHISEFVDNMRV
ncbi:MAG: hypothetical protein GY800_09085 [Planctomycetes bacterium]|nr:hypothetical protein [Planctomycetota bacterium]